MKTEGLTSTCVNCQIYQEALKNPEGKTMVGVNTVKGEPIYIGNRELVEEADKECPGTAVGIADQESAQRAEAKTDAGSFTIGREALRFQCTYPRIYEKI